MNSSTLKEIKFHKFIALWILGQVTDIHVIEEADYNQKFPLYSSLFQLLYYQKNHPYSWAEGKWGPVAASILFTIQVAGSVHHHIVIFFSP